MKITPSILFLAALSPAVILISGCAKADTETAADQIPATAATTTASDTAAEASVLRNASAAVDSPININDYTYDKRADLAAGMQRMAQACVADYTTMQTALAALPPAAVAKRDLAVDEFTAARTAMSAQIVNVRDGTVDDWSATKEKTALALKRLQDAVAGVKASTVS